jgi:hypothetical protein
MNWLACGKYSSDQCSCGSCASRTFFFTNTESGRKRRRRRGEEKGDGRNVISGTLEGLREEFA